MEMRLSSTRLIRSRDRKAAALARCAVALALTAAAGVAATDLRLLEAIKRRDRKAVTALLAQHADVNAAQPDGATALSWALYLDDRESADLLLAAGANVK